MTTESKPSLQTDTDRADSLERMVSLSPCIALGEYLKSNIDAGVIDFAARAKKIDDDTVEFYIRPLYVSGDTRDYIIGTSGKSAAHVENLELVKRLLHATDLAG